MCVWDALFGWKMEKGPKTARRTGPLRCTWFRMVVYYWLNLNMNRSAKNSFKNKIRIWNLCSVFLVHLSTPKPATFTPLNRLLQRHLINSIYKFYSNSSVQYEKLKEIQQLMHGTVKQVVEPSPVRWLFVEACVKMILLWLTSYVVGEWKEF